MELRISLPWRNNRNRNRNRNRSCRQCLFATTLAACALLLSSTQQPAHAQTPATPTPVTGPAFARSKSHLYVLGGNRPGFDIPIGQFISLDLTTSWTRTSPAWSLLPEGPAVSEVPAVFSSDCKTMIVFHLKAPNSEYRYDVSTGRWGPTNHPLSAPPSYGLDAVADPNTDLVYMAVGYTSPNWTSVDIYNINTGDIRTSNVPIPSLNTTTIFPSRWYYSNVWSQYLNSVIYFGGYRPSENTPVESSLTRLEVSTMKWTTLVTSGSVRPTPRADNCLVANDDGTRLFIYGGRLANNKVSGDLFILDTTTMQWSQGTTKFARMYAVCTVAGDHLLVWGGSEIDSVVAAPEVLIYNWKSDTWQDSYVPNEAYQSLHVPTPTTGTLVPSTSATVPNPTNTQPPSLNQLGAIVGGIVGGLALIGALVAVLFYRRQHRFKKLVETSGDHDGAEMGPTGGASVLGKVQGSQEATATVGLGVTGIGGTVTQMQPLQGIDEALQWKLGQLENQQRQIELQRQLLILQQQEQHLRSPLLQQQEEDQQKDLTLSPQQKQQSNPQSPQYGYPSPGFSPTSSPRTVQSLQSVPESIATVSGRFSQLYQTGSEPNYASIPLTSVTSQYPGLPYEGVKYHNTGGVRSVNNPHTIVQE
ncbi:hypothetical protein BGX33_006129 [Mortierella sp. NVP41]|nr:hypothetical protein BGX33_006129 [Mortierella sp. NVP41]